MRSEILADFMLDLNFSAIPQSVVERAKELMLDAFGVAIAGSNEPCVTNAINAFKNIAAGSCNIWGRIEYLNPQYCAMVNGIATHSLDFDDTHTEAILHASAILSPLCLSYGFSVCNDGEKILKAFIVGWEVGARIGIASKGTFHKRGFHTTAICGTFASVCACGILLDLNKTQIINAIGIAGSFASGVNEFLSNGSNSKVLHIANAIANGILIANLAKNNITGPKSIFEGRDNIFRTFGIEELCDKDCVTKGLGEVWQTLQVSIKPYPCCHFAHGLIDCALLLRGIKDSDIEAITCYVDEVPASFICEPLSEKYSPDTAYKAKFSMPFLFALAFYDGFINLDSYNNLNRSEVIAFAKKISYEKRQNSGFPKYFCGHIKVRLKNGDEIKKDVFINKGNFDNPLSKDELEAKFFANVKSVLDRQKALEIIDKITHLEKQTHFKIAVES